VNENRQKKAKKREVETNNLSFLVQKGRRKRFFRLKSAIGKYRRAMFFLIVSADTIRLSAGILIAFENSLIVFTKSLIGQSRARGLAKRTVYCKLDFKRFSAP
jgi:hypothetical protein